MSDATSRDLSRHQTLRAFKARGGNPAAHPDVDLLTEVEGGHSHTPYLPSYRRMLAVFKPLWKEVATAGRSRFHLTLDELRPIVEAWPHPR